ncbi:MAG: hypothetical protein FJX54_18425 [Alphaproteobacteria bacterium]|nr:hypothetical protein [Alphaproteobacteria bacterium]
MAERNLAVRLSVIDGGKVKAELRDVGESGERALKRIDDAAKPASRSLQAVDAAAGSVRGSLESAASRLGPVGAALTRLGPAGLVAGAALGAIAFGLKTSLEAAAEAEASYRRLEAVLKATGDASGLTAGALAEFAEGMEESTMASAEAVMDAAAVLATFRSVAGDTFTRALRLAQDLAAVFGQDLRSSAVQLGKALEDPVEGLNALRRVGISFTQSQREVIATLVETGRTAEAQQVILDALERQVGGAGAAEASGLSGAANRLADSWGNLLKEIGRTPAIAGVAQGALDILAAGLKGMTGVLADDPIAARVVAANRKLVEGEDALAGMRRVAGDNPRADQVIAIRQQEEKIAWLKSEVERLIAQARSEAQTFDAERQRAEDGRRAAETENRAETLTTQRKKIDEAIGKLIDDPAERITAVNRELDETRRRLEALRAPGENDGDVDAAIGQAEELARRRIAAIEKPAQEAAERMAKADTKVVADLERQMVGLADKRAAFIDQALSRLSEGAGETERAQVERLAGDLYDQKQAIDELGQSLEREQKLFEDGRRITEANSTALEKYAAEVERLDRLFAAGAIDAETHARALADAERTKLDASTDWHDGAIRALRDYVEESDNAARLVEQGMSRALRAGEDAFIKWATTGKLSAGDLFNTIAEEALRAAYRMAVVKPLAGILESLFGEVGSAFRGLFGGSAPGPVGDFPDPGPVMVAHSGGVIGLDRFDSRLADSALFDAAHRFHGGGIVSGEVPVIARQGEGVFTPGQMRALGFARAGPEVNVTVNVRNNAPGTEARTDLRRNAEGLSLDIMVEQVEGSLARNIGRGEGLAPTLERRYGLNPAAGAYR